MLDSNFTEELIHLIFNPPVYWLTMISLLYSDRTWPSKQRRPLWKCLRLTWSAYYSRPLSEARWFWDSTPALGMAANSQLFQLWVSELFLQCLLIQWRKTIDGKVDNILWIFCEKCRTWLCMQNMGLSVRSYGIIKACVHDFSQVFTLTCCYLRSKDQFILFCYLAL